MRPVPCSPFGGKALRTAVLLVIGCGVALARDRRDWNDAAIVGERVVYTVQAGDSLTRVSARFGAELPVIAAQSGLAPDARLRIGQTLHVDTRHIVPDGEEPIIVNIPQRLLFWRSATGMRAFPAAVGRPTWQTPVGDFTVVTKEIDPVWNVPPSIQEELRQAGRPVVTSVLPGPDNPLGRHRLALSLPGIGVHGTNEPASVFTFSTHGCIRMNPADIADIFDAIPLGTTGRVIYRPVLLAVDGGRVFVEVHRDPYRLLPDTLGEALREVDRLDMSDRIDVEALARAVRETRGTVVDVTK